MHIADFRFQRRAVSGINGYGPIALSDSPFPRGRNAAGTLIEALKSQNWDTQNPALAAFSQTDASACTTDELFVIGRNVYLSLKAICRFLADRTIWLAPNRVAKQDCAQSQKVLRLCDS
jgi:hypothetical protein